MADSDHLAIPDPRISYTPDYLSPEEADSLFAALYTSLPWRQDSIRLFGRSLLIPRLQCFVAEPKIHYTYSGLQLTGQGFPEGLKPLQRRLSQEFDIDFNAILANLYRDGQDAMGWHSDDEPELGENPLIASISLGASRRMRFKDRHKQQPNWGIELKSGSLLVMGAGVQRDWLHAIPRSRTCHLPRINLTFRQIRLNA